MFQKGAVAFREFLNTVPDPLTFLENIFAHVPTPIQICDAKGHSLFVNRAFYETFGVMPPPDFSFLDSPALDQLGLREHVDRAFRGEE
ncbi:MAG TPA: hypothetical protein VFV50_18645, partial [Bdellovibrionales bacterium]|nr:hypothetical protein [Bdellovibrionales bacterium]